jgi:hypothetical protein
MESNAPKIPRLFIGFVLLCLVVLGAVVWFDRGNQSEFTFRFDDAKGLETGAPVVLRGIEVGRVRTIAVSGAREKGVDVTIAVAPEYAGKLPAPPHTTARIIRGAPVIGKTRVELLARDGVGERMVPGTVVDGLEGWTEEKLWTAGKALEEGGDVALSYGRDSLDRLAEWADSEQSEKLKGRLKGFLESVEKAAMEDGPRAFDAALERGRALVNEVDTSKARETAEEVGRSLEALLERSKKLEGEARARAQAAIEELREKAAEAYPATGS